jgi:hypothetical protein
MIRCGDVDGAAACTAASLFSGLMRLAGKSLTVSADYVLAITPLHSDRIALVVAGL